MSLEPAYWGPSYGNHSYLPAVWSPQEIRPLGAGAAVFSLRWDSSIYLMARALGLNGFIDLKCFAVWGAGQLVACSPSLHRTWGSFPSTAYIWHGGGHL